MTVRVSAIPGVARRAWQRLHAHRLLNGALWLGLVVFFAMLGAVPTYLSVSASAILAEVEQQPTESIRPRLSYFFATERGADPQSWLDVEPVDRYLRSDGANQLGVETTYTDIKLTTRRFDVVTSTGTDTDQPIGPRSATALDGALDLMDIVDGRPIDPTADQLEVLVAARTAAAAGLTVGDQLQLIDDAVSTTSSARLIDTVVVGIWEPSDPTDSRWVVGPSSLVDDLIVSRSGLVDLIEPERPSVIRQAQWYLIGSAEGLSPDRVAQVTSGQRAVERQVAELHPGVALVRGPDEVFTEYERRRDDLQSTLRSYAIPGALITALFVLMVMGLNANQRRTELAVLRSRGIPVGHTLATIASELVVVIATALLVGGALSLAVVAGMVRTRAFLQIGSVDTGQPFWTPGELPLGLLAVAAIGVMVAQLLRFIRPAHQTIVARRSRAGRAGRLARGFATNLDLVAVAVVAALVFQRVTTEVDEPSGFDDPWLIGLPPAVGLAAGLLAVRLLPVLTAGGAAVLERLPGTSLFLASRRMSRAPQQISGPLVLIVVATSLAAFVASLSLTLERALVEDTFEQVGGDVSVVEVQRRPEDLRPIGFYRELLDVAAATQVLELPGRFGEEWLVDGELKVMAVDAGSFVEAGYWQRDFAQVPLRSLLGGLTGADDLGPQAVPDGVVVSQQLATAFSVAVGDQIWFSVASGFELDGSTRWLHTNGTVTGITDRFPRWSAATDDPLLVVRKDYLEAQVGAVGSVTTLLRLNGTTTGASGFEEPSPAQVGNRRGDEALDIRTNDGMPLADKPGTFVRSAPVEVDRVRATPDRQGVFGVLTATFVAATALALVSLGIQSLFAYRERAVEVGVLRALGLPFSGLAVLVAFDVVLLTTLGVGIGITVGVLCSLWLIPDIPGVLGTGAAGTEVAWATVAAVAGLFLAAVLAVVAVALPLLRRLKIFQAIKLGENL